MKSILIKDTTREEREAYVRESLDYSDIGCECTGGGIDYQLYIDGIKEIAELATEYKTTFVVDNPKDEFSTGSSCMSNFSESD